jgi:hypothetical protein
MLPRARLRIIVVLSMLAAFAVFAAQVTLSVWLWRWNADRGPNVRDDLPAMDRAVAATVTAVGENAAVSVTGLVRVRSCDLGTLRTGGVYTRSATFYVDSGDEDTLISRIAGRLPAAYQPRRQPAVAGGAAPLSAVAGHDVSLTVRELGDGWLVATATTGCTNGPAQPADPPPDARTPATATITDVLASLHTQPAELHQRSLICPGGHTTTVAAVSKPVDSGQLRPRVTVPAIARSFVAGTANRVAYRTGDVSVIIAASDDGRTITVRYTTSC